VGEGESGGGVLMRRQQAPSPPAGSTISSPEFGVEPGKILNLMHLGT